MRIMKSDEVKEVMKESPRRYTNPFLSDEENEKFNLWNQELEHSNIKEDLSNNCEGDKLRNSLAPSEFCEKETEVYTDKNVMRCELPELLICYKEGAFHVKDICVDEGIPHGEKILFDENNHEILCISSPVNVGKHDDMLKPEQLKFSPKEDYYMESNLSRGINGKFDTDLPVLEPTNNHMDIGDSLDEVSERKSDAYCGTQEVDADLPVNGPISDHRNLDNTSIDTKIPVVDLQNSIQDKDSKEVIDSVIPNEKEISKDGGNDGDGLCEFAPDSSKFSSESDTVSKATEDNGPGISVQPGEEHINSSDNLLDNVSTEKVVSNSVQSLQQVHPLPSLKSLLDSIDQQPRQSPVEETSKQPVENENTIEGANTLNLNSGETAISSGGHNTENLHELPTEPHGALKLQDVASDNAPIANPVHRGEGGESSFSVAGPVSGLITYSGPIAFSGSTSLRSDSSTTSTRSFAFPILQNEWNSSPVRMAKADRRRLQKHRGWRHGLLCCRF